MKGKWIFTALMMIVIISLAFYVSGQTPAATPPQQQEKLVPKEDPLERRVYKLEMKVRELERRIDTLENKMRSQ
jgi:hypothetical protein